MTERAKATWYRGGQFVEGDAPDWWAKGYAAASDVDRSADPGAKWEDLLREHVGLDVFGIWGEEYVDQTTVFSRHKGPEFVACIDAGETWFYVLIPNEAELLTFQSRELARLEQRQSLRAAADALTSIKNVLIAIARRGIDRGGDQITDEGEDVIDVRARACERRCLNEKSQPKAQPAPGAADEEPAPAAASIASETSARLPAVARDEGAMDAPAAV